MYQFPIIWIIQREMHLYTIDNVWCFSREVSKHRNMNLITLHKNTNNLRFLLCELQHSLITSGVSK